MGNEYDMTASKQSLKDKLLAIILLESSKPYREMDSALVTECVDFLMELEGKEKLTKSEIEQRVKDIPFKGKVTAIRLYTKNKFRAKRLAVLAAVLAVILTLFGIVAVASGNTFSELFRQMGASIYELLEDGSVNHDNITLIKPDETKTYSSIKALAEGEGIEILYPTWLPENEKIVKVWYLVADESEKYVFQCDNPLHSVSIRVNGELTDGLKANCSKKKIGTFMVYFDNMGQYMQASFVYNNNLYAIKSDTENNLFEIIKNLEGIN